MWGKKEKEEGRGKKRLAADFADDADRSVFPPSSLFFRLHSHPGFHRLPEKTRLKAHLAIE
jgi:hypothetical protein